MLLSLTKTAYSQAAIGAELDIIAAVILGGVGLAGGRGGVVGTMLGTLILGVLNNGMTLTGMPFYWQYIARGSILVISVGLDTLRRGGGYR
jgi:ribose/xylose/arabinose/galactoside ABC-type transport system permease subunit